jgi:hypothetical protein
MRRAPLLGVLQQFTLFGPAVSEISGRRFLGWDPGKWSVVFGCWKVVENFDALRDPNIDSPFGRW